jgi:hypothetical protein
LLVATTQTHGEHASRHYFFSIGNGRIAFFSWPDAELPPRKDSGVPGTAAVRPRLDRRRLRRRPRGAARATGRRRCRRQRGRRPQRHPVGVRHGPERTASRWSSPSPSGISTPSPGSPTRPRAGGAGTDTGRRLAVSRTWLSSAAVERTIAAPADVLYHLITEITSTGERSNECRRTRWLGPARGEAIVGARVRGHNRSRGVRWSRVCGVIEAHPGRAFAFPDHS